MSMLRGLEEGCQVSEEGGQLAQTFLEQLRSMGNVLREGGKGESKGTSVVDFPSPPTSSNTTYMQVLHTLPPLFHNQIIPQLPSLPIPTFSQPCIISPTIPFLPLLFIPIVLLPLLSYFTLPHTQSTLHNHPPLSHHHHSLIPPSPVSPCTCW